MEGKSIVTLGVTEKPVMDTMSEATVDFRNVKGQNLLIESIVMAAAGVDRGFFGEEQIRSVQWKILVYFIGGGLMVSKNSVFSAGIH